MQNVLTELEELKITPDAKEFLKEIASWCKFLSVLGFIGIGLLLFGSFFLSLAYRSFPEIATSPFNAGALITFSYIVVVIICIFPLYYLYQFSNKMKKALLFKEDKVLATAFKMLKSHYKFIGVFTIIFLSVYLLLAIVAYAGLFSLS
jgi:hypothetical protein